MIRVGSNLCCDGIEFVALGEARIEVAVLENDGCTIEDELDSVVDVAFSVELVERMDVENVLVSLEAAVVECG